MKKTKPDISISRRVASELANDVTRALKQTALEALQNDREVRMFFSPNRVPHGLNQKQLLIVKELSPLREWQRNHLPPGPAASEPPFHFDPDKPMSSQKFAAGVHKFLNQVSREIIVVRRTLFDTRKRNPGVIAHLRAITGR